MHTLTVYSIAMWRICYMLWNPQYLAELAPLTPADVQDAVLKSGKPSGVK